VIVDGEGNDVSSRACRDETEAWTYASTVRQHAYWLSNEKFREYYRLGDRGSAGEREATESSRAGET
jgi:hypothetical protein